MQKFLEYWPLILSLILFVTSVGIFLHWNNTALQVTKYTVSSSRIPESFAGFRIVQISDLHNTAFGKDNCRLLADIRALSPDIIVITGDIVHASPKEKALQFARQAVELAPTYYVSGNHEHRMDYETLFAQLTEIGVTVLRNRSVSLEKNGEMIRLAGIEDPLFYPDETVEEKISPIMHGDAYTILLSHRPELFDSYVQCGVDLAFTGHAHGGQFRLPLIGGLYVPNQGLFPKYDAGLFTSGRTNMIISRGLGNSSFPFRLFNRPEIVAVTLISNAFS
ncbi:MAG: metallophosphoesterase [Ruminococcaceae bacterium]|nr:metallophosphoesterase [Oscillospiraceae bacterium]